MELPDDVLANILRRVHPPRDIAVCRRVRRGWRAVIDAHRLVLPHLVSSGDLLGIFVNYKTSSLSRDVWSETAFFGRAPLGVDIDRRLSSAPAARCVVIDHCNGLLLCTDHDDYQNRFVYNPATCRSSARLPAPPRADESSWAWGVRPAAYLLFDPAVSLNYEVFLLPEPHPKPWRPEQGNQTPPPFNVARLFVEGAADELPEVETDDDGEDWIADSESEQVPWGWSAAFRVYCELKNTMKLMEWPPPVYVVQVFSSATGRWEDRAFFREGDAAGTVADMWPHQPTSDFEWSQGPRRLYGIYWQQSLYVHCHNGFVTRFNLNTGKYSVIGTPKVICQNSQGKVPRAYLLKSESGLYYISVDYTLKLHVWLLNESVSHERPVWEMKHNVNLRPTISQHVTQLSHVKREEIDKSWILDHEKAPASWDKGWDSGDDDDDDVASVEDQGEEENGELEEDAIHEEEYEEEEEEEEDNVLGWLDLLGLHPKQEIVFLGYRFDNCAYTYCLQTSKLEYLGDCGTPDSEICKYVMCLRHADKAESHWGYQSQAKYWQAGSAWIIGLQELYVSMHIS